MSVLDVLWLSANQHQEVIERAKPGMHGLRYADDPQARGVVDDQVVGFELRR